MEDDESDVNTLPDANPLPSERDSEQMAMPASNDPGSLYQNLSPVSSKRRPRVALGITISSDKLSKSGKDPFTITLQLANITSHSLVLPNLHPVTPILSSFTNGPIIRITEDSIRGAIAQYRLEVCTIKELTRLLLASKRVYQNFKDPSYLEPLYCSEYSAWINNATTDQQDAWCEDLKKKLIVGLKYKVDVVVDTWFDRWLIGIPLINGDVRVEALNRYSPILEVVH